MKNISYKFIFILLITFCGCTKIAINRGDISVLKNGVEWDTKVFAEEYGDNIHISIMEGSKNCITADLSIRNVPKRIGTYRLKYTKLLTDTFPSAFYATLGCDVILKSYHLKDSSNIEPFVKITEVKNSSIEGEFQFIVEFPSNPNDTITFSKGSFKANIID